MEWFSDYQRANAKRLEVIKNGKYRGSNKLVPHLYEHKNCVTPYRNLKFLVNLGVEVRAVHTVSTFEQKPWLKPYIDFNTDKRKEAKNEFEKDCYKLMNNSVVGKTMENVKNRIDLRLAGSDKKIRKLHTKMQVKDSKAIGGVHLIQLYRKEVINDKPVYRVAR